MESLTATLSTLCSMFYASNLRPALTILSHLASLVFMAIGFANNGQANSIFFGPTPYLSSVDSPFAQHLGSPEFYLEDFEDGELNTPGIFQPDPFIIPTVGLIAGPNENTDSVDADDGILDGTGNEGHSLQSISHLISPVAPHQRNQLNLFFEFDEQTLGFLPNTFGFVWTDGPHGIESASRMALSLDIRDENADRISVFTIHPPDDMSRTGGTTDDVFFGVRSNQSISSVILQVVYFGDLETTPSFEVDHVQYGFTVPEQDTFACCALALGVAAVIRIRK